MAQESFKVELNYHNPTSYRKSLLLPIVTFRVGYDIKVFGKD